MQKKGKKHYPQDPRSMFGFSTIAWVYSCAATLIGTFFMPFLTDYSGIDASLGKVGFAAAFGTILLLIARIVDIIDDPLQAWLVDNSKPNKFGKYRRFNFIHVVTVTVALIALFGLPAFTKTSPVVLCIWVGCFYLIYEFGQALHTFQPLLQGATYDNAIRAKITKNYRFWQVVAVFPVYFFISIVTTVNQSIGDMSKAFTLSTIFLVVFVGLVSFIGTISIKENISIEQKQPKEEKISFKTIVDMIRKNKPLQVHFFGQFVFQFIWAIISAIGIYFIKWYYCADWVTGTVDALKYSSIYSMYALAMLVPNFLAPFISQLVVRKAGSSIKALRFGLLLAIAANAAMFIAYISGLMQISPMIYIALFFLVGVSFGVLFIPQQLLWVESADYVEYNEGRKMAAIINSANSLSTKAVNAISVSLMGLILVIVGYSVDATTGSYMGDLSGIPQMVAGFGIFMTIVPACLSLIAYFIYRKYPLTPEKQLEIANELKRRRECVSVEQ